MELPFVFPRHSQLTSARQGPPTPRQISKETNTVFLRILPFHLRRHPARMCRSAAASPFQTGTNSTGGATMAPVTVGWLPGPQTEDPEGLSGFSPETLILSLVLVVGIIRNSRPPPFLLAPHQCIFLFPFASPSTVPRFSPHPQLHTVQESQSGLAWGKVEPHQDIFLPPCAFPMQPPSNSSASP